MYRALTGKCSQVKTSNLSKLQRLCPKSPQALWLPRECSSEIKVTINLTDLKMQMKSWTTLKKRETLLINPFFLKIYHLYIETVLIWQYQRKHHLRWFKSNVSRQRRKTLQNNNHNLNFLLTFQIVDSFKTKNWNKTHIWTP